MKEFFNYQIEGETTVGVQTVLLTGDDDLTAHLPWHKEGYTVQSLLTEAEFNTLRSGMQQLIFDMVREQGVQIPADEEVTNYHHYLQNREDVHLAVARWGLPLSKFPLNHDLITARVSRLMGVPLRVKKIPSSEELVFGFRVVRPGCPDESPFHRDAWLDFYRHTLNLWLPVAGCDAQSTLTLFPGSHQWPESDVERTVGGGRVNGRQYRVPAISAIRHPFETVKPNPRYTEALLFSPYLIHGGAVNGSPDQTRVSIELRFERRP